MGVFEISSVELVAIDGVCKAMGRDFFVVHVQHDGVADVILADFHMGLQWTLRLAVRAHCDPGAWLVQGVKTVRGAGGVTVDIDAGMALYTTGLHARASVSEWEITTPPGGGGDPVVVEGVPFDPVSWKSLVALALETDLSARQATFLRGLHMYRTGAMAASIYCAMSTIASVGSEKDADRLGFLPVSSANMIMLASVSGKRIDKKAVPSLVVDTLPSGAARARFVHGPISVVALLDSKPKTITWTLADAIRKASARFPVDVDLVRGMCTTVADLCKGSKRGKRGMDGSHGLRLQIVDKGSSFVGLWGVVDDSMSTLVMGDGYPGADKGHAFLLSHRYLLQVLPPAGTDPCTMSVVIADGKDPLVVRWMGGVAVIMPMRPPKV